MTLPIRFGLPVLLIASLASAAAPECDRGCLRSLTDRYLDAMLAHNPSKAPFASKVRYTENTLEVQPGLGIWKTAAKLRPHRQYYQDPVSASALFRGVVEETGLDTASIVAIRLKTVGGKITEVEAVIARKGSHSTYTPDALRDVDPRLTSLVPASQRVSRDQLKAIAETYWDGIVAHDGSAVKAVKGCDRIENGLAMTNRTGPDAPPVLKADCGGSAENVGASKG